jgi:hypothetical protein
MLNDVIRENMGLHNSTLDHIETKRLISHSKNTKKGGSRQVLELELECVCSHGGRGRRELRTES